MRVILAPNSFRDGPDANIIARAMAEGVQRERPDAEIFRLPLADGGDGTLDVMARHMQGQIYSTAVHNPRGKRVLARYAISSDGTTGIIEMAEASGARLVPVSERDPFYSSTYGTGELIRTTLDAGVKKIFLGAGGSGTIDVGAGALAALGARFRDIDGNLLTGTPAELTRLIEIDVTRLDPRLRHTEIIILSDIRTPLNKCNMMYGLQKGVCQETSGLIDKVIETFSLLAFQYCRLNIFELPWMGAGGGLTGGLVAFAGASTVGGAEWIARRIGLPNLFCESAVLITSEGRLDAGSFHGKLPITLALMATDYGIPAIVIAGRIVADEMKPLPKSVTCVSLESSVASLGEMFLNVPERITEKISELIRSEI